MCLLTPLRRYYICSSIVRFAVRLTKSFLLIYCSLRDVLWLTSVVYMHTVMHARSAADERRESIPPQRWMQNLQLTEITCMGKSVITFKKEMLDVWYVLTVEENILPGYSFRFISES